MAVEINLENPELSKEDAVVSVGGVVGSKKNIEVDLGDLELQKEEIEILTDNIETGKKTKIEIVFGNPVVPKE